MSYRTPLEQRIAKKTTQAIIEHNLIEDGDRIMVGLSGGKDSWALIQILDVLRKRAPITFSICAINVNSGYADFTHDVVTKACGDLSLKRQRLKRMIAELELEHPEVKNSMIKAIGNVAPRHLLD